MRKGYVYVLSNPSMPGLYKIGLTTRTVEERMKELGSQAGVPTPFVEVVSFLVPNCHKAEALLHAELNEHRIENKEFFKTDKDTIADAIVVLAEELEKEIEQYINTYTAIKEIEWYNNLESILDNNYEFLEKNNFDPEVLNNIYIIMCIMLNINVSKLFQMRNIKIG